MAAESQVESQTVEKKESGSSKKIALVCLAGGVAAVAIGGGVAYYYSEAAPENSQTPDLFAGLKAKTLKELTPDQIKLLEKSKYKDVPKHLKELYRQVRDRKYVMSLKKDSQPNKDNCERVFKVSAAKDQYVLEIEQEILDAVIAHCKPKFNAEELKKFFPQPADLVDPPHDDNNPLQNPPTYKAIKDFLNPAPPTVPTLMTLLANSTALADFILLNKIEDAETRKKALGDADFNRFENLLNSIIGKEYITRNNVSENDWNVLVFAEKKQKQLELRDSQVAAIKKILALKAPSQSVDDVLGGKKFEELPKTQQDLVKANAQEQLEDFVSSFFKELRSTDDKSMFFVNVTAEQFIAFFELQKSYREKIDKDMKVKDAIINNLEEAINKRVEQASATIKDALKAVDGKAANYRKLYDIAKDSKYDVNVTMTIVDILCMKAIQEQVTNPAELFAQDSYQSICLAVDAHIDSRADLRTAGNAAGFDVVKYVDFKGPRNNLNFITAWPDKDVKSFKEAVDTALKTLKDNAASNTKVSLLKQSTFARKLSNFLKVLKFLYDHMVDTPAARKEFIENAFTTSNELIKEAAKQAEDIATKAEEAQNQNFNAAVEALNLKYVVSHMKKLSDVEKTEQFMSTITAMKNASLEKITADKTSFEYKRQVLLYDAITAYLSVKKAILSIVGLNPDIVKSFAKFTPTYNADLQVFVIGYEAEEAPVIISAINEHKPISDAMVDLAHKLTAQMVEYKHNEVIVRSATMPFAEFAIERLKEPKLEVFRLTCDITNAFETMVRRASLFKALKNVKEEAYLQKIADFRTEFVTLSTLSTADKKYFDEKYSVTAHGSQLLPLFTITSLTSAAKDSLAKWYALSLAFYEPPANLETTLKAATEANSLSAFLNDASNIEYIKQVFAVDFINSNRKSSGHLECNKVLGENWRHDTISFTPLKDMVKDVEAKMHKYATGDRCSFTAIVTEEKVDEFPLYSSSQQVDNGRAAFTEHVNKLVNWAVKECFPLKA